MNKGTIKSYCQKRGITLMEFSKITNVSLAMIYKYSNTRIIPLSLATINKIYDGTLARFGEGLVVNDYLDIHGLK